MIIEFASPASTCEYHFEDPDPPLAPGRVRSELNIYTRNFKEQQPQETEMVIKVNKEVNEELSSSKIIPTTLIFYLILHLPKKQRAISRKI